MQPAFHRLLGLFLMVAVAGLALMPEQATAQRWSQRAQIVANVPADGVMATLRDTLISVARRNPDLQLRRAPDDPTTYAVDELQDVLIDESAIALNNANTVYVDYAFQYRSSNFSEEITSLYFQYQNQTGEGEDTPIFYVDATQPAVQRVLRQKGTYEYDRDGNPKNLSEIVPFVNQLQFARIANPRRSDDVDITEIGGQVVRGDDRAFERQKRQLFNKVLELTY